MATPNLSIRSLLTLLGLLTASGVSYGQNYERYKPLSVPHERFDNQQSLQSEALSPVEGDDSTLVDRLEGVIVLDSANKVEVENAHEGEVGINYDFEDTSSLVYGPAAQQIIDRYIGGPITLRRLNQLSRDLILLYRRSGQPVVDVAIPEQKVTAGVVQVVVTEARIGRVTISDGCYFSAEKMQRWVSCTRRGDRIYENKLNNDLFWLNQNPFRSVTVDLLPGATKGTTDVAFKVNDVLPWRTYAGYEDTGVQSLGLNRLYTGFIYGNAFGSGGTLSYQYTADADFRRLHAHAVNFVQPINRRWSWNSYGSWARVSPDLGAFSQNGESWQAGLGLTKHLHKSRWRDTNISAGFDFKQTNNNLEFGGQSVQASAADLVQLRLSLFHLRRYCNDEYFFVFSDNFIGPGDGFTSDHNDAAFNTIRANTSTDYFYTRLRSERAWKPWAGWMSVGRFSGQLTTDRLLFSETLGLGGFDTIRGYDQRTLNGDAGWLASWELGPDLYRFGSCHRASTVRAFGFVDMGNAHILDPVPGEEANQFLISTGVGARLTLSHHTSLRIGYGYGFEDIAGSSNRQRIHIGLVSQFGKRP
ncbi:MAG: ShlB/FhaC/HecB family hemolysin secretion/activation protein [Aureliella sp.]